MYWLVGAGIVINDVTIESAIVRALLYSLKVYQILPTALECHVWTPTLVWRIHVKPKNGTICTVVFSFFVEINMADAVHSSKTESLQQSHVRTP